MKLSLGPDARYSTIALSVSQAEQVQLEAVSGYSEAYGKLKTSGDVKVEKIDDQQKYLFLLRRIGRQKPFSHERRLRSIVDVLDCVSLLPSEQTSIYGLIIGTDRVDGRLPLGLWVKWPEAPDIEISDVANTVMRSVGSQLRYESEIARSRQKYGSLVYAYINRADHTRSPMGVSLQTNPAGSASIETIGDEYEPEEPMFRLECHNLYSYKQQLICLAGALAIAQLSEVANDEQIS